MPIASVNGVPGSRCSGRMKIPAWSSPSPSSRVEQSIPFDQTPAILRRPISMPSGITVPMVARGTRSPAAMLKAPQPISSG